MKRRIMIGSFALSAGYYDAYYLKALKSRRLISNDFQEVFKEVDVIMGPVSPQLRGILDLKRIQFPITCPTFILSQLI